jgi:hypothetical protein
MNNRFYTITLLLSALTLCNALNAMRGENNLQPFNAFKNQSDAAIMAASLEATAENLDDIADDPSPKAEAPNYAQQQQAPEQPIITLGQLMGQSTLENTDICIQNFIHHNPTLKALLEAGLARIEAQMCEAEFVEGLLADIEKFYATYLPFIWASGGPEEQREMKARALEFKKAQFKAFSFAQLFEEQEIASPPASPRRRTYQARLTGTPPTSPRKNQSSPRPNQSRKRTVSFRQEVDVEIIPNVKRATKRARHS